MHELGVDGQGYPTTVVVLEKYKLKRVCAAGLAPLLIESQLYLDCYRDLVLHRRSERLGTGLVGALAAFHDLILVENIGVAPFDLAGLRLIRTISENAQHYPETVGRITSCGNGWWAVAAWKAIRPFVPVRTTQKITVLGAQYTAQLARVVPMGALPRRAGGLARFERLDRRFVAELGADASGACRATTAVSARSSCCLRVRLSALCVVGGKQ